MKVGDVPDSGDAFGLGKYSVEACTLLGTEEVRSHGANDIAKAGQPESQDLNLIELPRVDEAVGLTQRDFLEARRECNRGIATLMQVAEGRVVIDQRPYTADVTRISDWQMGERRFVVEVAHVEHG